MKALTPDEARAALVARPEFAGSWANYGEAIESKYSALKFAREVHARDGDSGEAWDLSWVFDILPTAEAFFWSADIARAVREAAVSFPDDVPLTADVPFTTSGWFWFGDDQFPLETVHGSEQMSAICWGWKNYRDGRGLYVRAFAANHAKRSKGPIPYEQLLWPEGWSLSQTKEALENPSAYGPPATPGQIDAGLMLCKFVASAAIWMRQRIAVAERTSVDRFTRKRLMKIDPLLPSTVRVVMLRQREGHHRPDGEQGHEYQCRWIVSGHWRNQFYKSTGQHRPKWILPHVKGPDDKPLKVSGPKVFGVVR